MLTGKKAEITVQEIDVKNYAKYILEEGEDIEKRELLSCLRGKIYLTQKQLSLTT